MADTSPMRDAPGDEGALRGALVQTSYRVIDAITAVAARHDLSLSLWRVVAILRDRTPTMSELATHLDLDRSTITGIVDRAVDRGLLVRTGDIRDRRSRRVALTDPGQELAQECADELERKLAPLTTRLTAAQRQRLTSLLTSLAEPG